VLVLAICLVVVVVVVEVVRGGNHARLVECTKTHATHSLICNQTLRPTQPPTLAGREMSAG